MAADTGAPAKVFISYRRDDGAPYAGRLYDRLADAIGAENIFMDVDSISFGLDFADAIRNAVSSCDVLLAIIGPDWLTATESGRRRLDDPDDFVRLEIEVALERNVRVVPVLVDDAELPGRSDLPESLQPLVRRQTLRLSHAQFRLESQRLIDDIRRLSGLVPSPGGPPPVGPGVATTPPTPSSTHANPPLPPPSSTAPATPIVRAIVEHPKVLTLTIELSESHLLQVDNSNFFGLIKLDGQEVVKRVNPEGSHDIAVDDAGTQVVVNVSFGTTWTASLKDIVVRIGDDVIYQKDKL